MAGLVGLADEVGREVDAMPVGTFTSVCGVFRDSGGSEKDRNRSDWDSRGPAELEWLWDSSVAAAVERR